MANRSRNLSITASNGEVSFNTSDAVAGAVGTSADSEFGELTVITSGAITLPSVSTEDLAITASGLINQVAGSSLVATGDVLFSTTAGQSPQDAASSGFDSGNVQISNNQGFIFGGYDNDAVNSGVSTVGGNLTLSYTGTVEGSIDQNDPLEVAGNINRVSNTGVSFNDVNLPDAGNILTLEVTDPISGDVTLIGPGNVDLSTRLSSTTISGDLTVTAVGSEAFVDASGNSVQLGGDAITLDNIGNRFSGQIQVVTAAPDKNNVDFGISQSGAAISVAGNTFLNAGGATVNATASGNIFGSDPTVNGFLSLNAEGNSVVNATGDLVLGASQITNGDLTVTVTNGDITGTSNLDTSGTATFSAAGNEVNLTGANQFGSISVTANNASITESDGIEVVNASVVNNLTLISGGDITQVVPADPSNPELSETIISPNGTTTLNAGSNNITLTNIENQFGTLELTAVNVDLTDSGAIEFGDSTVTGNLDVTAGGDITQVAGLTVTGTSTFRLTSTSASASNRDASLDNPANNFANVLGFENANDVTVVNEGDLTQFQDLTISGNLNITGDEINFRGGAGSINSSGLTTVVSLQTYTTSQNSTSPTLINVNSGSDALGDGVLDITETDLDAVENGFNQIILGQEGAGDVQISPVTFVDSVLIQGSSITASGNIQGYEEGLDSNGNTVGNGTDINLTAFSGSITVNNIDTSTSISGSAGSISLSALDGQIELNGNLTAGALDANSGGSGSVSIESNSLIANGIEVSVRSNGSSDQNRVAQYQSLADFYGFYSTVYQNLANFYQFSDPSLSGFYAFYAQIYGDYARDFQARSFVAEAGGISIDVDSTIDLTDVAIIASTGGAAAGGDIDISADTFNLTRSSIQAASRSTQATLAGNITLNVNNLTLAESQILAETSFNDQVSPTTRIFPEGSTTFALATQGANITINGSDTLALTGGSLISARGVLPLSNSDPYYPANPPSIPSDTLRSSDTVSGGNIRILGFLQITADSTNGNNDIVTNANPSNLALGGLIEISQQTLALDFVESSDSFDVARGDTRNQLVSNGVIAFLGFAFVDGASQPDPAFVNAADLVGNSCAPSSATSSFTVGGRGGTPANPLGPLSPVVSEDGWIFLEEATPTESFYDSETTIAYGLPNEPSGQCYLQWRQAS